jgi:hypothetical protein
MRLDLRWFIAFSFLLLAAHEAHELAHAVAGRLICGEWPLRDFNAWRFAGVCASSWPSAWGPLFTYGVMLAGALIAHRSTRFRAGGVALIFAANPFARIFTAAMGSGDEMVVAQWIASLSERTPALKISVFLFVTAICGSALYAAWRAMRGVARRGLWFAGAMIWPMVLTGVGLFLIGNGLLRAGVMSEPSIHGAPLLVVLVSGIAIAASVMTVKWFSSQQRLSEI